MNAAALTFTTLLMGSLVLRPESSIFLTAVRVFIPHLVFFTINVCFLRDPGVRGKELAFGTFETKFRFGPRNLDASRGLRARKPSRY